MSSESGTEKETGTFWVHSFDDLVRIEKGAMWLDNRKILFREHNGFDASDIYDWIGLVKFKGGRAPDIRASISSSRGENTYKVNVSKLEGIESLDQELTRGELLGYAAKTKATLEILEESKMMVLDEEELKKKGVDVPEILKTIPEKVDYEFETGETKRQKIKVLDLIKEVYPAIDSEIGELKKDLEKMEEFILTDPREVMSFDDLMDSLKTKTTLRLTGVLTIGSLLLASCSPPARPTNTSTPTGEGQPTVTYPATATEQPTLEITATPDKYSIPQTEAGQYPGGISVEQVGENNLRLARDETTGNLIGWYSENDSRWYFVAEGMEMAYLEDFEGWGPTITMEVAKTEDITAQTLADWEAGKNVPQYSEFEVCDEQPDFGSCQIFNLTMTDAILESDTINPGGADEFSVNRIIYTYAFMTKNGLFYTIKLDARLGVGYGYGGRPAIDEESFAKNNIVGETYMVDLGYFTHGSSYVNQATVQMFANNFPALGGENEWTYYFGGPGQQIIEISADEISAMFTSNPELTVAVNKVMTDAVVPMSMTKPR